MPPDSCHTAAAVHDVLTLYDVVSVCSSSFVPSRSDDNSFNYFSSAANNGKL